MRRLAAVALTLLCLNGCGGCRDADDGGDFNVEDVAFEAPEGTTPFVPTLDGPLRVLAATPSGPMVGLDAGQGVAVTFTRPMVPLGEPPAPPEGALALAPAVEGTLRWEGSQTLVFQPSAPLPPATAYRATLRARGLASLSGDAVARDTAWAFETPRPAIVETEPAEGEEFAAPTGRVRVVFNQPVAANVAGRALALETEGGARVSTGVEQAGDSALVLTHAALRKGQAYRIVARRGLRGSAGPLGSSDARAVAFRVHPEPALVGAEQARPYEDALTTAAAFDPERGVTLRFATPVRFGDLRRALRVAPAVALPPGIEAGDETVATEHVLRLEWRPETAYAVTVQNLRDAFGQTLARGEARFRTGPLAPSLRVPEGVMVVEARAGAAVPIRATNVDGVRVAAERLTAATLVPRLLAYDNEHYYGLGEEGEPGADVRPQPRQPRREVALGIPRNRPGKAALRFDTLLAAGAATGGAAAVRTGVVAFAVTAPALGGEDALRLRRGVAQITDLGLTVKHSPFESLVFVTELGTARGAGGVRVSIRDLANRVRWSGTTGADGRVAAPGWARLGITAQEEWQKPVQFVLAERGADLAFTSNLYEEGIEPYRFDLNYDWSPQPETFAGAVFTDRGLYRAGESGFVKGWLRRRTSGEWAVVRDSVRVLVYDPRDRVVLDRRLRPSETGGFDFPLALASGAAQGPYSIRVIRAADTAAVADRYRQGATLADGSFRVESFRTASFRVASQPAAEAFVAGDVFEGTVSGRYLFGAPMGGAPVRYDLRQSVAGFSPPGYDGWRFGAIPFDYAYAEGPDPADALYRDLAGADAVLGPDGTLRVRHALGASTTGVPLDLTLTATVTDPSRQQQSDEARVTLHPGAFYIGLKPRTAYLDLSETGAMELDAITVDPNGAPSAGTFEVELVREEWISVREVGADGRLRWRSERRETASGRQRLTTTRGRMKRLRLPVTAGGTYLVRATGTDVRGNVVRTEAYFYAAGEGYVAWRRNDDDRIDLVPDRTQYAPGETARLMVQSPYEEATALVTVEREGILSSRVVTLRGSAPQIEVELGEEHLPNAFVSVVLLKGRVSAPTATADVGAPGFRIGYATLSVDAEARHLRVEVEPSKAEVRPGEEMEVALRLVDRDGRGVAGEIAFSAADAGVVDLIKYRLPDPYETFYGPRALAVSTSESRAALVEQRAFGQKEEDAGGGGGDGEARLRQDFRALAHWQPALRTDGSGRARVRFRVPERLTTLRLMASAATADQRFGAGASETVVTQPLVLTPALPRFARAGDAFEAGVLVTNRTDAAGEAVVGAAGQGIALAGPAEARVQLAKGETKEVRFRWTAGASGAARLTFTGRLGREEDGLVAPLVLAERGVREVTATFARADADAAEALAIPADRITAVLTARLSSTALAGLGTLTRDLFTYPYGCLEQRTSAVRPLFLGKSLFEAYDRAALGDADAKVAAWADALEGFWTGDGFTLWPAGSYGAGRIDPFVSAYTVLALAEARAAGYATPDALTREAVGWLAGYARRASERPDYLDESAWADSRALMFFALARHGVVLESEIQALATAPLTAEGDALLLRAVAAAGNRPALAGARAALAERLTGRFRPDGAAAYLDAGEGTGADWIFASDVRATALGLTALANALPAAQAGPLAQRLVQYLVGQRSEAGANVGAFSTQEGAALVEALAVYAERFEQATPNLSASVRAAGREVVAARFSGRTLRVSEGRSANLPAGTTPVSITRTGSGPLYYALRLESVVRGARAPVSEGLALGRTYELLDARGGSARAVPRDANGRLLIPAGALVRVTLRLVASSERAYVVVDDALPAGLEAVNAALATTDQAALDAAGAGQGRWWGSFNHTETRDDRVLLFADLLDAGEHTFTYVARATTPGTYGLPPAVAEMMYRPEVRARTASGALVVGGVGR